MAEKLGKSIALSMLDSADFIDTIDIKLQLKTENIVYHYKGLRRKTEVSVVNFGTMQLAMFPGEPLSGFGKKMKTMLPGPQTMFIGTVNDYVGYIVPEDEWGNCDYSFLSEGCFEESRAFDKKMANFLTDGVQKLTNDLFE